MKRFLVIFYVVIAFSSQAHAYIDPNTGGLFFQMGAVIFGFILATLFLLGNHINRFFLKIKNFIKSLFQ